MTLQQVAFDIETTGLDVTDVVTVVGFALPLGIRVFCQTRGRSASGVADQVRERVDRHVSVSVHESEATLIGTVQEFVASRLQDDDVLLAACNGETWNGGFDLPFLRTRFAQLGVAWPFTDVPYTDLLPVVSDLFNTTVDGEARAELVSVYDTLCDGGDGATDPFDDSAAAVSAFEDGRFTALVLHNIADVLRTKRLGRVAERYCSKSDFQVKSLTPTRPGGRGEPL